jgi:tetratricopeptide (TPR) repeat protein/tRNA A-37 threonylcarbamoyl transferase component Bud32
MADVPETCPSENDLADYVTRGPDAAAVEPHLDACATCRATVARLLELAADRDVGEAPAAPLPDRAPGPLDPGARVGRYVVTERVGAGAMGTVYAARDPDLARTVALKLLRPELWRGERAEGLRARMAREARALARISHPNVITVYDIGVVGDQIFVAMELVTGGTLRSWLREAPRSWRHVLDVYLAAGEGLRAAHAAGITHRDFKPDNVLVGADGRVRVTDFGLSRADRDDAAPLPARGEPWESSPPHVTAAGALVGTPVYMAPEQLAGGAADARSDLFSFCVALHEGLYGERPFTGATLEELRRSIHGPVRDPPAGTRVPAWLRRVLIRGLSADPEARHLSMAALLTDLSRDPARARRRLGMAALGAVLVGAAAVLGWGARARVPICQGSEGLLAGVWDDARRADVQHALAEAAGPGTDDAWTSTAHALDGWARGFVAMRREACLATRVRGEQPEAQMAARMACLERQLDRVRATVDVLAHADGRVVERSAQIADALPNLDDCADAAALRSPVEPPPAAEAGRVAAARRTLAEAEAADSSGHYEEAQTLAEGALREAVAIGYAALVAEAQLRVGIAQAELGRHGPAAEAFLGATLAAETAHDDRLAARAWMRQVRSLAYDGRFDDAHLAARHAAALLARLGGGAVREADLENSLGVLALCEGRFAEATVHEARALELRERLGASAFTLANAHLHLGSAAARAGDLARAEAEQRTALRLSTEARGPGNPDALMARRDLARTLAKQGRTDEALSMLREPYDRCQQAGARQPGRCAEVAQVLGAVLLDAGRADEALEPALHALSVSERVNGPESRSATKIRSFVADVYLAQGRARMAEGATDGAVAPLERALALRPDPPIQLALADALWRSGGDRRRARSLAEAAQAGGERDLPAVRAWLTAHPAPR